MIFSHSMYWLLAGALLVGLEILVVPGIGVLFAGLGALTVGFVLMMGGAQDPIVQFSLFFLATGVWALVLWKPLKAFLKGKDSGFSDMIGSTAVVFGQPLEQGKTGQVRWSGTIMKCQLDSAETGTIEAGDEVTIASVSRGILIVERTKNYESKLNTSDSGGNPKGK